MANLIVCCDGTWNTPSQEENGRPSPTNVVKIHSALAPLDTDGTPQKTYYRPGVGSSGGLWTRLKGGGLGVGLDDDIKSAYHWLSEHYLPSDKIFLFGFSRGAFAVRSLAGVIGKCGLLAFPGDDISEAEKWRRVDAAYKAYRTLGPGKKWSNSSFERIADVKIGFMGVWDTVGALGIPDEFLINVLDNRKKYQFHDTELGPQVAVARHAIAVDERRRSFAPTLWTSHDPSESDVVQTWFTGVHGDVGGGYADSALGDITLSWMIDEAQPHGAAFRASAFAQLAGNHLGQLHDSTKNSLFTYLKTRPRSVPDIDTNTAEVHDSVRQRQATPPLVQPGYWETRSLRPGQSDTFNVYAREQWNYSGIYLQAGVTYDFTARGEWLDGSITCSPDGAPDGFHLAYALVSPFDWYQRRRRESTKNPNATIPLARREQDLPWFCLVGVIASGTGVHAQTKELCPHEVFRIGSQARITPKTSGYLYCFANDVWYAYANNKGKVRLTVSA
ncbi:DUF2235 domain-containing protein [Alloyangia pacifica]|uniref:DUF2235 domain-containing protein n=1 Tax=Alloyangia pacifica TaxID=311180 RepID=UPI001CD23C7A|nr:DUF2235 domain-containing protein [Alloyangia pacifica]MCA0996116.1 DUF2235 domain-containing protein [Alloyangia pacifica]